MSAVAQQGNRPDRRFQNRWLLADGRFDRQTSCVSTIKLVFDQYERVLCSFCFESSENPRRCLTAFEYSQIQTGVLSQSEEIILS
jgi:hypothetical protein